MFFEGQASKLSSPVILPVLILYQYVVYSVTMTITQANKYQIHIKNLQQINQTYKVFLKIK